jgi:hypothetical protein
MPILGAIADATTPRAMSGCERPPDWGGRGPASGSAVLEALAHLVGAGQGRPISGAPWAASRTRAALSGAVLPSGSSRLFSKPMRAWPPRAAAVSRQAFSCAPKAQTAQGSGPVWACTKGSRSAGRLRWPAL